MKTIQIDYFAALRDYAGIDSETVATEAVSAADLYEETRVRHKIELKRDGLRVARNAEFTSWEAHIEDGDTIVFLPPVAGG